jgi:dGTPase
MGTDISYARHPLAFLVEAADDICYTIIDFEDGINMGLIPEDYALEYLIKLVKDTIDTKKYNAISLREDRLGYLRALAINTLIRDAVDIFMQNETEVLRGGLEVPLLALSKYKAQVEDIIRLSVDRIYLSKEVVEKEIAGYRIITDILEVYSAAMIRKKGGCTTSYDQLILRTLPGNYQVAEGSCYEVLLGVCCYVASLSDSGAVYIHNKISGESL